jgi:hypothetical protein
MANWACRGYKLQDSDHRYLSLLERESSFLHSPVMIHEKAIAEKLLEINTIQLNAREPIARAPAWPFSMMA